MSDIDDRALELVLDDDRIPVDDPELASAVQRARRDIERIRLGIALAAEHHETTGAPTGRRWLIPAAAAAAAVVLVGAVALVATREEDRAPVAASTSTTTAGPSIGAARPGPPLTLDDRAAQAERIVVGTITAIDRGEVGGLPYVLARVAVSETIKGEDADDVVAFDYDLGGVITSSDAPAAPWAIGDEVLLFLVSDAGTVSEELEPAHLQVAEGAGGRYAVVDGEVVAPFTLEDVRRASAR